VKKRDIAILSLVLAFVAIIATLISNKRGENYTITDLDKESYEKVKSLITTRGTRLITVKLISEKGRMASGTLIKNGDFEVVITVIHFFFNGGPSGDKYQYILDGKNYNITKVNSHPLPGPLNSERDIAFCFGGEPNVIGNNNNADKRDTSFNNIGVSRYPNIKALKMDGSIPVEIIGILFTDPKNPLYLFQYDGKEGESGSGVIGDKRFFVLKGYIKDGLDQVNKALGITNSSITILTEL
jgi:hypothetical protein